MGDLARSDRLRVLATIAFVALLALPALADRDSFPLSTYPMYASARGRVAVLYTAIGLRGDDVERLGTQVIAATDDPLIAQASVRDAVLSGRADELCRAIAARTAGVERVQIVGERLDVVDWAAGRRDSALLEREVHATCEAT
jgi:hypothetical protein